MTEFLDHDATKISWSRGLKNMVFKGKEIEYKKESITTSVYRPFTKMHQYFSNNLLEYIFKIPSYFPNDGSENKLICLTGRGASKDFSALIVNINPDYEIISKSQCFPLFVYEKRKKDQLSFFDNDESEFVRRDGISNFIIDLCRKTYGIMVSNEDVFYYVYGFLHSPDYREMFAADLKKMLPRIPLVDKMEDFWAFSKAGRKLADLHINYETVAPAEGVKIVSISPLEGSHGDVFKVQKMRFPSKEDKSKILFNSKITIENIPAEAYQYVVNGKSAIEWIMERYQVTIHKESQIKNDPNDWAEEVNNPRYILDLLLSIVNVSVQTVEIVKGLPKIKF